MNMQIYWVKDHRTGIKYNMLEAPVEVLEGWLKDGIVTDNSPREIIVEQVKIALSLKAQGLIP